MNFLLSPIKRQYIAHALYCVRRHQDASLPSCEKIIEQILADNLAKTGASGIRVNTQRKAEMAVYNIALSAVDSSNYRNLFGTLNSTGEQFLHICRSSLDHFVSVGYVTQEEYDEHSGFLVDCDLNTDRYSLYPQHF